MRRIWKAIVGALLALLGIVSLGALRSRRDAGNARQDAASARSEATAAKIEVVDVREQAAVREVEHVHEERTEQIAGDLPAAVDAGLARAEQRASRRAR